MLHRVDSLLESGVPVVLDSVVSPTHEFLGDIAPFLFHLVSENEKNPLLGLRPFSAFNLGVEVIEPSLPARLARSTIKSVRQVAPHHVLLALTLLVDVA